MDPQRVYQLCADAVASVRGFIVEGLVGTTYAGFYLLVVRDGETVYGEAFGSPHTKGGRTYESIALRKADLVQKHRRSLSDLIREGGSHRHLAEDYHNGGFYHDGVIVAVAGAGHIGNAVLGRLVLSHLTQSLAAEVQAEAA